jgi:hypothetical protein
MAELKTKRLEDPDDKPAIVAACFCKIPPQEGGLFTNIGGVLTTYRPTKSQGDARLYFVAVVAAALPCRTVFEVAVSGPWDHNDTLVRGDFELTPENGQQVHATAVVDLPVDRPGTYTASAFLDGEMLCRTPLVLLPPTAAH